VLTVRTYDAQISAGKRLPSALFHRLLQSMSDFPHAEGVSEFRLTSRRVTDILVREMPERGLYLRGVVSGSGFGRTRWPTSLPNAVRVSRSSASGDCSILPRPGWWRAAGGRCDSRSSARWDARRWRRVFG